MGVAMLTIALLAMATLVALAGASSAAERRSRLRRLTGEHRSATQSADAVPGTSRRSIRFGALATATGVAAWVTLGGVVGLLLGVAAAAVVVAASRAERPGPRAQPDDVVVVVELLAGCLSAGLAMSDALQAASVAAGSATGNSVVSQACLAAAAALRRGAPPVEAWASWQSDPSLAPIARATTRTGQSGAGVADELRRVAARLRAERRSRLQHRVGQASVWVVVPLGAFFLPAFILVAVVPMVIGLFSRVH
jgi:pilus assembly protein TadC